MVACGQKPKENERVVIQVIWGAGVQAQKSEDVCVAGVK